MMSDAGRARLQVAQRRLDLWNAEQAEKREAERRAGQAQEDEDGMDRGHDPSQEPAPSELHLGKAHIEPSRRDNEMGEEDGSRQDEAGEDMNAIGNISMFEEASHARRGCRSATTTRGETSEKSGCGIMHVSHAKTEMKRAVTVRSAVRASEALHRDSLCLQVSQHDEDVKP